MIDKSPPNPLPKITSPYAKDEPYTTPGTSIKSFDGDRTITLEIHKHTDKTMIVKLRIPRKDIVEQRKSKGYAIYEEIHEVGLNFNELVNRIFCVEHEVYYNEEAYPESIKEVMKRAYD